MRILGAIAVALILSLTGACGAKSIKFGPDDAKVKVSKDGKVEVKTNDGTFKAGTNELPDSFPKGDVPLTEGEVISSFHFDQGADGKAWNVTILSPDKDLARVSDKVASQLKGAGFEQDTFMELGDMKTYVFSDPVYGISISIMRADGSNPDGVTVTYQVVEVVEE